MICRIVQAQIDNRKYVRDEKFERGMPLPPMKKPNIAPPAALHRAAVFRFLTLLQQALGETSIPQALKHRAYLSKSYLNRRFDCGLIRYET